MNAESNMNKKNNKKSNLFDNEGFRGQMDQDPSYTKVPNSSIMITEKQQITVHKPKYPPAPGANFQGNRFNREEEICEKDLRERERIYHQKREDATSKSIAALQKQLEEQHKKENSEKEKATKRIEEDRLKQRKRDENLKKQRENLMKGEKERLKMLEQMDEIDVGDNFQNHHTITLETQKRFKNYDYLLKRILEAKYHQKMVADSNNTKIPDNFKSTVEYQNIYCQLCASECISNMNQVLISKLKSSFEISLIKNLELNYDHEDDNFIWFELEDSKDSTDKEEFKSIRNAEFVSRSNYLVIITNMSRFNEEDVNTMSTNHFCLLAFVVEDKNQIKLKVSVKFQKILEK